MKSEEVDKTESLTKRAVTGTAWSALSTVGKQVLTFASVATVARMLGPNPYGIIGMAVIVLAFISNIKDLGTGVAIIQRPVITDRLLSSLFWINLALGTVMSLIVAMVAPVAAHFFHTPELTSVLRALSISFLFAAAGVVHNALLNRRMAFRALAINDLCAGSLTFGVALLCARLGYGVWSLVFANLVATLSATIGVWLAARFRPRLEFDWPAVKSIAKFSTNLSGFGIVNYGCRYADNLIVGRNLGSIPLGYYQMAYNIMMTPLQNISSVISQVLFPAFSRIQDDNERFRHAYVRGCMIIAVITFPIMGGLAVIADPLIRALLGTKWLGTIPIFEILAPVGLVQSIQTTVGIIYQAKGRTDWMLRWSLVVLTTTVIGFLIGVHWGVTGVATSYAIVYIGGILVPGFLIPFRLIGLKLRSFGLALLPQLVWTVLMMLVCMGWLTALTRFDVHSPWVRVITTSCVGAVTYIVGILMSRPPVVGHLEQILAASEKPFVMRTLGLMRLGRQIA